MSVPPESLVLGALVGRGGFANVYEAHQPALERKVAVKCLHKQDQKHAESLFVYEAKFTARLNHPNILPVHDLVLLDGRPALVMKLVEGVSWAAHLDATHNQGAFELSLEVMRLRDVARATAFAHSRGVLHLDLKPANVMLGDFGETLVMDWGCAVLFSQEGPGPVSDLPMAIQVKSARGTPVYMAPELARGEGARLGPATDVFLLGAILHELLTHQPLRESGSTQEVIAEAQAALHRTLSPALDPELRALCVDALAPEPENRLRSAAEFAARLGEWLDTRESRAQTARGLVRLSELSLAGVLGPEQQREAVGLLGVFEQAGRSGPGFEGAVRAERRTRRLLSTEALRRGEPGLAREFALALPEDDLFRDKALLRAETVARHQRWGRWALRGLWVAVALGGLGALGGWSALTSYEQQASVERQRALGQEEFSKILLESLRSAEQLGLDPALVLRVLGDAEAEVRKQYADEPLVQAELWTSMGSAYKNLEQDAEAERYLRRAMLLLEQTQGQTAPQTVASVKALAAFFEHTHRFDEAARLLESVVARMEAVHGSDSTQALPARSRIAGLRQSQGRYADALKLYEHNLAVQESVLGAQHPETLRTVAKLAWLLTEADRLEEAEPFAVRAHRDRELTLGADHPETLSSAHILALWMSAAGQNREAAALLRGVVSLRERTEGFENLTTLSVAQNLVLELRELGNYTEAHALAERVVPQFKRLEGARGYSTQVARSNLGLLLQDLGRLAEAETELARSHAVRLADLGEKDPKTLISAHYLGALFLEMGRTGEAEAVLASVNRLAPEVFGPSHANTLEMRAGWARVLAARERHAEARSLASSLAETAEEDRGLADTTTHVCLDALAEVLQQAGAFAEADSVLERLLRARVEVLGVDHPLTLRSATTRVQGLRSQGRTRAADALEQTWRHRVLANRSGAETRPEQQRWLEGLSRGGP